MKFRMVCSDFSTFLPEYKAGLLWNKERRSQNFLMAYKWQGMHTPLL